MRVGLDTRLPVRLGKEVNTMPTPNKPNMRWRVHWYGWSVMQIATPALRNNVKAKHYRSFRSHVEATKWMTRLRLLKQKNVNLQDRWEKRDEVVRPRTAGHRRSGRRSS